MQLQKICLSHQVSPAPPSQHKQKEQFKKKKIDIVKKQDRNSGAKSRVVPN